MPIIGSAPAWSDQDENAYRMWLKQWSQNTGIPYNPDDSTYDYRKAYKMGLAPTWQPEHQDFRWSDIGKSPNYQENKNFNESEIYKIWDKLFGGYGV